MADSRAPKRQRTLVPSSSSSSSEANFSTQLPPVQLHRFNRKVRTSLEDTKFFDVVTNIRDGTEFVVAAPKTNRGASFFTVTSSNDISKAAHARWLPSTCFVTMPRDELNSRFKMKHTKSFDLILNLLVNRNTVKVPQKVGEHYSLVPLVDMPLDDYIAECDRIMALPCQILAAGSSDNEPSDEEPPTWPPVNAWPPRDGVMDCVVLALYRYAHTHAEDPNLSILAGLYFCSLGDSSMSLEDILSGDDQRLIDLIYETWTFAPMEERDDEPFSFTFRNRVCDILKVDRK